MTDTDDTDDTGGSGTPGRLRIDKWLWYARFFKTRSLAAKLCNDGGVRMSGTVVTKAHASVKPGDVLTFAQGRHIRVIKVVALGSRRGPAPEAQALYEDLSPPVPEERLQDPFRPPGAGRPTKRDRRAMDALKGDVLQSETD
ncbi:RNA-binding S4 domain-containing protein [Azospirillum picis]|uniref:Ribosome-associated heat shock protein Hsp15 n=1 Tax=Azospirillum picis TaxID=488438 RepID=A0ABU0MUU1_9PROT|nr:RNA-binding S4 domain-containing protein [Azospirillum picis]MBP2301908.1 ribosome-associated heat shock protein Hsp15 [Azospirillum picis]MDQ0537260.1 ribosome-associated heat shock protein Hsp15 [Azospirillum picis]